MLLLHHYWIAFAFTILGFAALFAWHQREVEG
jgi:hypothetical protein